MTSPFKMVAFWCWYRGRNFHGYQGQRGLRTVQGELLRAFSQAGLARNPVVAGRTDKGVSARMQVLSGRVERDVAVQDLPTHLNALLPPDLRLHLARDVNPGFHAAWSASAKEYRYHLDTAAFGEVSLLREAAALIPGTRSFRVFHFKTSADKLRTVKQVEVLDAPGGATLRFVGESFARHMVRMLVGGVTAVSRGEVPIERFRQGLREQCNLHCPTAAAEPLTLWDVGYPADIDPFTTDERRSFCWASEPLPSS
jgi:tRNA pseudouridine38-40 synthase